MFGEKYSKAFSRKCSTVREKLRMDFRKNADVTDQQSVIFFRNFKLKNLEGRERRSNSRVSV